MTDQPARRTWTIEDYEQILRAQETVAPGDYEQDVIVSALRIATAVMRPGVIESIVRPSHEVRSLKLAAAIRAAQLAAALRAALTKETQT